MEKLIFKGKEFKGSEGEFFAINYAGRIDIQNADHYGGLNLLDSDEIGNKYEANARLFANSKNLLKAAIKVCEAFDYDDDSKNVFKQLETEILKSL